MLLAAKSIQRLPVHFTLDNEINSRRIGIDDFEFVIPRRVQSGCKFFRQFRGHTAIVRQNVTVHGIRLLLGQFEGIC